MAKTKKVDEGIDEGILINEEASPVEIIAKTDKPWRQALALVRMLSTDDLNSFQQALKHVLSDPEGAPPKRVDNRMQIIFCRTTDDPNADSNMKSTFKKEYAFIRIQKNASLLQTEERDIPVSYYILSNDVIPELVINTIFTFNPFLHDWTDHPDICITKIDMT
jgi:hypothetical protein